MLWVMTQGLNLLQWLLMLMLLPLLLELLHLQLQLLDRSTVLLLPDMQWLDMQLPDMLLSTVDVGAGEMFGRSPDINLVMDGGVPGALCQCIEFNTLLPCVSNIIVYYCVYHPEPGPVLATSNQDIQSQAL